MEPGANRANSASEDPCRIGVAHLLQVAEHYHLPVMRRQGEYRPANSFYQLAARELGERILPQDQRFVRGRIRLRRSFGDSGKGPLPLEKPENAIASHAIKIGRDGPFC